MTQPHDEAHLAGNGGSAAPVVPGHYLVPFILTTCCFALWGFANDVTNPLVKVFKEVFLISNAQSSLVQFAFYGGYFTMALPAAFFIRKFSYKAAIMLGLSLFAIGALMSIPAASYVNFWYFLLGFYVITFGLAFLETSCNPYILAMGPKETATQRLNLAQAFNPIGSLTGMIVAAFFVAPNLQVGEFRAQLGENAADYVKYLPAEQFEDGIPTFKEELPGVLDGAVPQALEGFRSADPDGFNELQRHDLGVVKLPYVVIAGVLLLFATLFAINKMPRFEEAGADAPFGIIIGRLLRKPKYWEGVIAQAFYVGAQITCWTFIIHYGMEQVGLTLSEAQRYNIAAMVIFLVSRFICTFLLKYIQPGSLLAALALGGFLLTIGAIYLQGQAGLISLVGISACMSLMFPTIYGIALDGLEQEEAKLGSAGLIMAIVGGAVLPLLQGRFMDLLGVRNSFWLPAVCFIVIAIFGFRVELLHNRRATAVVE